MNTTFSQAVGIQKTVTENEMPALKATGSACTDLFFKIGASRGKDIIPTFVAAFVENQDVAVRIALWVRDVRGGAGERQLFRDILVYLSGTNEEIAIKLIPYIPELGRWDDLLVQYKSDKVRMFAYNFYLAALVEGNQLAGKWAPREKGAQKQLASALRKSWGFTAKDYRQLIVKNTNVVENLMCSKQWEKIDFSQVPSVAAARYKTAFYRNAETAYTEYVERLTSGDKSVKVNASAIFPHDVIKGLNSYSQAVNGTQANLVDAQWDALPDYMGDASILPMVDVSGSMCCPVGGNPNTQCMDIAVALGMYCSEKNTGKFKDLILTFSSSPNLMKIGGSVTQRYRQLVRADWGMSTNITAALETVLQTAVDGGVSQEEMPKTLLILSDMQFDRCTGISSSQTALEMARSNYAAAGYSMPQIVFWNLRDCDNAPATFNEQGVALISGYSPAVLKGVLKADPEMFNPETIMLSTVMVDRYRWN